MKSCSSYKSASKTASTGVEAAASYPEDLAKIIITKVVSLLLSMLSGLVVAFLPGSGRLLISWLRSPSAVILEPRRVGSDTVSIVSPSVCRGVMGLDAVIFVF